MTELYQSLSHSKWDCKYHVVFCTMLYSCPNGGGEPSSVRHADIWDRFSMGWRGKKECQILEGHLMPDHVHMCIAIPPKHPVASVIGFLKGKSAIATRSAGG